MTAKFKHVTGLLCSIDFLSKFQGRILFRFPSSITRFRDNNQEPFNTDTFFNIIFYYCRTRISLPKLFESLTTITNDH